MPEPGIQQVKCSMLHETKLHQTIKKVSQDYEALKYNTAIAAMMALINEFYYTSLPEASNPELPCLPMPDRCADRYSVGRANSDCTM